LTKKKRPFCLQIQQELAAYYIERQHFDVYYENQNTEEIKHLLFYRRTPERVISFLTDHYFAVEEQKSQSFIYKLKLLIKYGFTDFKKLKETEIDILLNLQKEYYDLKITRLEQRKKALEQELANAKFEELLTQHKEYSTILFKQKLYRRYHNREVDQFASTSYKSCFDKFIERFPVVLSTTHSLRNCIPVNYLFDYLIIDESSQVDLLSGALALSCSKNVIIVGDTKQLPQIVDEKIKRKIQAMDVENIYNYFQHNVLSSMLALYQDMPRVVLKEHYRCHPKIIGFCNQKYYHGELIPFTQEDTSDEPFILYRTSKGNHMREVTKGERLGKFNQREMDVILEEVLKNPNIVTNEISEIGFTTPYRNQADRASKTFDNGMECDTVHKYQGREKKVMIMSTVLDNTFLGKMGLSFVDDPCKVNVAVSRAQEQFILVTDHSLFDKAGKEISDLVRYIEYHTLDDNLIESQIVSVFDLLYKEYSSKLIALKNRLPNISKYQSENIIWRLLHDIISEDKYNCLEFTMQVLLKNLLKNSDKLKPEEVRYVNHNSSVDFVVYYKLNKKPILIIEIDGFAFHENNPEQLIRDALKNSILKKYDLPLLRLATTGNGEEERIKKALEEALNGD
jgi:superfamily I DNA and/or RNA helicase